MSRNFTWDAWDFDCDGEAYIIAKDECTEKEKVPDFICRVDDIDPKCKPEMEVKEGWCKFQVRSDWEGEDPEPRGWYVIRYDAATKRSDGTRKPGWFPVWIVRKGEWY